MKTKINAALTKLHEMHQASHIREEGNVKYQAIVTELEQALLMEEVAPIIQPTAEQLQEMGQHAGQVMNDHFAAVNAKLDTVIAQTAPAPAPAPAV